MSCGGSASRTNERRLAAMHREGVEFVVADCLTKAVVAEIIASPAGGADEGGCTDG